MSHKVFAFRFSHVYFECGKPSLVGMLMACWKFATIFYLLAKKRVSKMKMKRKVNRRLLSLPQSQYRKCDSHSVFKLLLENQIVFDLVWFGFICKRFRWFGILYLSLTSFCSTHGHIRWTNGWELILADSNARWMRPQNVILAEAFVITK